MYSILAFNGGCTTSTTVYCILQPNIPYKRLKSYRGIKTLPSMECKRVSVSKELLVQYMKCVWACLCFCVCALPATQCVRFWLCARVPVKTQLLDASAYAYECVCVCVCVCVYVCTHTYTGWQPCTSIEAHVGISCWSYHASSQTWQPHPLAYSPEIW